MKQTRRKELRTNELRIFLQETMEWIQRNSTWLLAGLAVVVVVLVLGLLMMNRRYAARQNAWTTFNELSAKDVSKEPEALDRAHALVMEYGNDPELGPDVVQLEGNLAYDLARSLRVAKDKERRIQLFQQARASYEDLLKRFGDRKEVANGARMSLAAIDESLVMEGRGSVEQVRRDYEQVLRDQPNAFAQLAQENLSTLDERLTPLKIVATRPAAPPTTAPAATRPAKAPTTRPAATAPSPMPILPPKTRPS